MKVCGLRSATGAPLASAPRVHTPENFCLKSGQPPASRRASATMKPTLCRLLSYSRPGLPRPTTRCTACLRLLLLVVLLVVLLRVGRGGSARRRSGASGRRRSGARSRRLFDFLLGGDDGDDGLLRGEAHGHALGQLQVLGCDVPAELEGRNVGLDLGRDAIRQA